MAEKVALFAFNGEMMCFVHLLLNTLDMDNKGYDVKLVMEGSATKLIAELADPDKPFANLYAKVKEKGLIDCVCKACSAKMGTYQAALDQGLPTCDEMSGHPSVSRYMEAGYRIVVF